jgi:3-hydroxyisobutyrate dehydrogenase-like beta-hydroxyacid dehydrogenase
MARHVLDAGHELAVWNRTPGKAGELVGVGAREALEAPRERSTRAGIVAVGLQVGAAGASGARVDLDGRHATPCGHQDG